ncbi:hypothetical protein FLL45_14870 [Aliikangiella marina]|uniref:Cytochrome c domain-containing protein n=1 Tax=Aliikangiella marina TaxID=1712262 RepID=A0A545T6A6_9GAMM|nr:hypothetical protein [Aliikangiella marina]TQV72754.1 hypothetical protein FLL45_14870 [Aliikangiella marina]
MKTFFDKTIHQSALMSAFLIGVLGCGSVGDSDVGEQADLPPIAVGIAVGLGADNSAREGTEVILTAKDSDGQDTPIFEFNWSASSTNPSDVQLRELTANAVSFTAPKVVTATDYRFDLVVIDADGGQATDSVTITVVPARDLNRFLAFDSLSTTSLDSYQIAALPLANQTVDAANAEFSISVNAVVHYPDRNAICTVDGYDSSGEVCLTYLNNNSRALTQLDQQVVANWRTDDAGNALESRVTLDLPQLIIDQFNQDLLDDNASRDDLLDLWKADDIEIELTFDLTTSLVAELSVLGPNDGSRVNLGDNSAPPITSALAPITVTAEAIRNSGRGRVESKATAEAYYAAIDPTNSADTLNKWLVSAGFAEDNGDGTITVLSNAINGVDSEESEFAHAVYTNNYDLGFGRDMYVRVDEAGNVYSYVVNYPTLEAALKKLNPLATVVMEYSPPAQGSATDEKFVKFYTYIPNEEGDQVRVTDFNFDGRGQKYMPGVCAACHGGEPKAIDVNDPGYVGNINATFLPWDLDSFLYSDTDPAIVNLDEVENDTANLVYNRASQEEQFRKLNQAVYHTYVDSANPRFDNAIDLIGGSDGNPGWYSDATCSEGSNTVACISGAFNGDYVPTAWAAHSDLYSNVVAQHCRMCHVGREGTEDDPNFLQMATPDDLLSAENRPKTIDLVFNRGVMPMARLTMDRFWTGTDDNPNPTDILWTDLGQMSETPTPGAPLPEITSQPIELYAVERSLNEQSYLLTKLGRHIEIDASESLFTESFEWTLLDSTTVPGFESCLNDPQALVASGDRAVLTPTIANADDQFYCVQMTASNDLASVASNILFVSVVDNRQPQILFASDCRDQDLCLSVSELNADPASSILSISAVSDPNTLDFTDPDCELDPNKVCVNVDTFFQIVDQDVADGLDPPSIITFELSSLLTAGTLTPSNFTLQELLLGNVIRYQATIDEVGANALTESLEFDVYDNGVLVSGLSINSAEININPVSDNSPVFGAVDNATVNFGAVFNSSNFDVTDADEDILTLTNVPTSLGDLATSEVSSNADVTTYNYTFTAKTAAEVAGAGSICTSAEVFNGGNTGSFQLLADDGSDSVDVPVTRNVSVTLTPSLSYSDVVGPFANKSASGGTCSSCHVSGPGSPNWASDINGMRQVINLASPTDSTIFNNSSVGHTGGTYTIDFVNNAADRNLLEWIYQCSPQ